MENFPKNLESDLEPVTPLSAIQGKQCHKCGKLLEKHYIAIIDHGKRHEIKVYDYMS